MNDYELVVKRSKKLEGLLEEGFFASGRGLHEKITSVENKLPQALVKKLRFIASVRNRLIHDDNKDKLDNRTDFEKACNDAEKSLNLLLVPAIAKPGDINYVGIIVGMCLLGLLWWLFFSR